jgi:hypothetical protein
MRFVSLNLDGKAIVAASIVWALACSSNEATDMTTVAPASTAGQTAAAPAQPVMSTSAGSTATQGGSMAADPMGGAPASVAGMGAAGVAADSGKPPASGGCPTFDSSFLAIQKVIFEGHGCTADACHGSAASGGLNLLPEMAYKNLVNAKSMSSKLARVQPGTATESFLWQKLAAATIPDRVKTTGSPMPVGAPPLSADELEAMRIWILHSAPEAGNVGDPTTGKGVGDLLHACTPPTKPIKATPLEAPAKEAGVQFVLPRYLLKAGVELEQCTPFAYDYTKLVPAEYKDESRNVMFVNSSRVLQDPASHHMVVWNPSQDLSSVPSTGWKCSGGARDGQPCSANNVDCGADGACAGQASAGTFCSEGGGLLGLLSGGVPAQIANTQSPQEYIPPFEGGVYWEIPLKGVLWFNSHSFNLSDEDTNLDARMNFFFAKERMRKMVPVNVVKNEVPNGQAPFTKKTYCSTTVVPQNNSIAMMTGHTHRHGQHFWAKDASGKQIYESFIYNDPVYQHYEPWLEFAGLDEASRTIEFCAEYNNGLNEDGVPDIGVVTRKSRMPANGTCTPVACTKGKVGATCSKNADCNSAAGGNDGECDACPITTGLTTENEMFVLMPWYVLPAGQ